MRLLLLHPEVATRDCQHCLKFLYDNKGDPLTTRRHTDEEPDYMARDHSSPSECRSPKGCPKGTPENPKTLNERNWLAYEHYRECRAVGKFPDDAVVRRNAAVIRAVEDEVEAMHKRLEYEGLRNLLAMATVRRGL